MGFNVELKWVLSGLEMYCPLQGHCVNDHINVTELQQLAFSQNP